MLLMVADRSRQVLRYRALVRFAGKAAKRVESPEFRCEAEGLVRVGPEDPVTRARARVNGASPRAPRSGGRDGGWELRRTLFAVVAAVSALAAGAGPASAT